ncbi:hypothetical protein VTJ04DRAFT_1518 [Mycothermus thermophilus]|uniref:uncharacterized protein n=1 Tax=Humicola insolens TaxID=85995 RepID=UPI0037446A90
MSTDDSDDPPTWPSWSPSRHRHRPTIPRRFFQVPSEQRKLLERPAAWTPGSLNIPPGVLEDARKTRNISKPRARPLPDEEEHDEQAVEDEKGQGDVKLKVNEKGQEDEQKDDTSQATSTSTSVANAGSKHPRTREDMSSQSELRHGSTASDGEDAPDTNETEKADVDRGEPGTPSRDGTPLSWSESPEEHLGRPRYFAELERLPSTPTRAPEAELPSRRSSRPSASISNSPMVAALSQVAQAVGMAHGLACAPQFDFSQDSSSPSRPSSNHSDPLARVQRPSRAPEANRPSSNPESEAEEHGAPKAVNNEIHSARRAVQGLPEPTPPSAQVVIPCTMTETSPVRPAERPRLRLMKRVPNFLSSQPSPGTPPEPQELASSPAKQPDPATEASQPGANSSNDSNVLPPNGPPSQVPYTAFKVAYPDYKGSLGDFLRSVMCILNLQKKKLLPEFLYDDFVRVFSTDYLDYIEDLDPSERPLKAYQFYNENVSEPLYMKRILTKDNVADIPAKYPEKARVVQVASDAISSANPSVRPSPAPPSDGIRASPTPANTTRSVQEETPVHPIPGPSPQRAAPSPPLVAVSVRKITPPPRRPAPGISRPTTAKVSDPKSSRTWIDSSLPTQPSKQSPPPPPPLPPPPAQLRPEFPRTTRPPPSSLAPPSTAVSNADSIPEMPRKKRRLPSAADGGPRPGTQFKRPATAGRMREDELTRRARAFKEFLEKKKAQSSSAPMPTPTPPQGGKASTMK